MNLARPAPAARPSRIMHFARDYLCRFINGPEVAGRRMPISPWRISSRRHHVVTARAHRRAAEVLMASEVAPATPSCVHPLRSARPAKSVALTGGDARCSSMVERAPTIMDAAASLRRGSRRASSAPEATAVDARRPVVQIADHDSIAEVAAGRWPVCSRSPLSVFGASYNGRRSVLDLRPRPASFSTNRSLASHGWRHLYR